MHYARQGIVTPEMEYIAIRENCSKREWMREYLQDAEREARLKGNAMGAASPRSSRRSSCATRVARGRAVIPANINPRKSSR